MAVVASLAAEQKERREGAAQAELVSTSGHRAFCTRAEPAVMMLAAVAAAVITAAAAAAETMMVEPVAVAVPV